MQLSPWPSPVGFDDVDGVVADAALVADVKASSDKLIDLVLAEDVVVSDAFFPDGTDKAR